MKGIFIILGLIIVTLCATIFYNLAQIQPVYQGLPTVPCIDYTKPVIEQLTFTIKVNINGNNYPVDSAIGHDFGNCLHDIYVNDATGKVFIRSNDLKIFTLGQFFDVWHKTLSKSQIFGYQATNGHTISVLINGKQVSTTRETKLLPGQNIEVVYK